MVDVDTMAIKQTSKDNQLFFVIYICLSFSFARIFVPCWFYVFGEATGHQVVSPQLKSSKLCYSHSFLSCPQG